MRCPPCPVQQVQQELKLSLNQEKACELRLLGFPHLGLCFVDPLLTQHESTEPIPPSAAQKVMFSCRQVWRTVYWCQLITTQQHKSASCRRQACYPGQLTPSPLQSAQIDLAKFGHPQYQTDRLMTFFLRVWNSFFLTLTARPLSAQGLPFGLGKSESKHPHPKPTKPVKPPPERPPKQVTDSRLPSCAARFQTRTNSTPWGQVDPFLVASHQQFLHFLTWCEEMWSIEHMEHVETCQHDINHPNFGHQLDFGLGLKAYIFIIVYHAVTYLRVLLKTMRHTCWSQCLLRIFGDSVF